MANRALRELAELIKTDESGAREFCTLIQSACRTGPPSFQLIASAVGALLAAEKPIDPESLLQHIATVPKVKRRKARPGQRMATPPPMLEHDFALPQLQSNSSTCACGNIAIPGTNVCYRCTN